MPRTERWLILQLTAAGEDAARRGVLATELRAELGRPRWPVWAPVRHCEGVPLALFEGYAFIGAGLDPKGLSGLYVEGIILRADGVPATLTGAEIGQLHLQLDAMSTPSLPLGTQVDIVGGKYRGLDGTLADLVGGNAIVHVSLRSLELMATVPQFLVQEVSP